jgi:hypothetical protein
MLLALGRSRLILQFFDSIQVGNSSLAILTTTTWLTHAKPLQDDSTYTTVTFGILTYAGMRCHACDANTVRAYRPVPAAGPRAHDARGRARRTARHTTQRDATSTPHVRYGTAWHTTTQHAAHTVRHARLRLVYTWSTTHSTPHNTTRRDRHVARTAWHTTTQHAAHTVRHARLDCDSYYTPAPTVCLEATSPH